MIAVIRKFSFFLATLVFSSTVFANGIYPTFFTPPCARFVLQGGWFDAYQGKSQHVDIEGLIGNEYDVTRHHDQSGLFGLGYYINAYDSSRFSFLYGINAFYLAPTTVKGVVIQEGIFENLSYSYDIVNYPIYAATKLLVKHNCYFDFTFDLGVGANIIEARHFHDKSLDGGVTIPDRPFTNHAKADFSFNTGIGVQVNHVFGNSPLECGYRFFYLGEGRFGKRTNQLLDDLKTGRGYANAVVCSISM